MLAHEASDLLVVHDKALVPESGTDTPPPIGLELVAEGGDHLDEGGVVEP